MGRKEKRLFAKIENRKNGKAKYSLHDVQKAINIAIEMRKLTKGHLFSKNLKERCTFCGATMKTRKMCDFWFLTFIDRLQVILINPSYFTDQEIEALWMQNGEEYKDVKIPINTGAKSVKKKA
jgi:hypothetical protein